MRNGIYLYNYNSYINIYYTNKTSEYHDLTGYWAYYVFQTMVWANNDYNKYKITLFGHKNYVDLQKI